MTLSSPSPKQDDEGFKRLAGWKRLLPLVLVQTGDARRLRVEWLRLGVMVPIISVSLYFFLVAGVWAFLVFERGITETRFVDLLLPGRWQIQRTRAGDHYVALGRKQLEAGELREAFTHLRVGVAKSPSNLEGRLALAKLLAALHRVDLAEQTLTGGLPFATDQPAYLRTFFGFLLEQQNDATVRTIAQDLLGQNRLSTESASVAALAAASASYFRGNYDDADDFIARHHLQRTYEGRLLSAQIEWERGYRELALTLIRAITDEFPDADPARTQLAAWLRELGRTDEFRRLTLLRLIAQPDNPAPRIELLRVLRVENPARLPAEIESLFRASTRDEKLLLALADYAVETGDATLARRIDEQCRTQKRGWETAAFLHVEALIVARDYRGALELTRQLLDSNRDWAKRYYALFNSLQSIAYYGLGDSASAQLYLANFLGQADLRADNLLAVAQRFLDVGAQNEARDTLAHAVAADPLNQAALTRLIQLDLDLNRVDALPATLRRLLAMRRPAPAVLRAAQTKLGSDLLLFSRERDEALTALQRTLAAAPVGSPATP